MPIKVAQAKGMITADQLSSLKSGGQTMNAANLISEFSKIGASVAGGVAALNDAKKAQQFQNYLSDLTQDQADQFQKAIDNAKTDSDKLALITAVYENSVAKRISNLNEVILKQEQQNRIKKEQNIIVLTIIGVLVILLIKHEISR